MKKNSVFVLCVLVCIVMIFVACNGSGQGVSSKDLGRYYEVVGSLLDEDSFIELKSGNIWFDGEDQGTFRVDGEIITLYDGDFELMSGTISNDTLTFDFMGKTTVYKKSNSSMGSGNIDSNAMIKSIQGGKVDGLNVLLEVEETIDDIDLSGMIATSKGCSWALYTSRTATAADAIATKMIVPKSGSNTYYIVVTSSDGKINRTYTLNVWKNYYVTLSFFIDDKFYDSEQVLTHTTYGDGPSCQVEGYTFNGWGCSGYYVEESKSFYANLTPKTYTARFDSNGGSTVSPKEVTYNENLYFSEPIKSGYTFSGWCYRGEVYTDSLKYTFSEDITFTAMWQPSFYEVVIMSDNENAGKVNSFSGSKAYNSSVTLTASTNPGYNFIGWFVNGIKISSEQSTNVTVPDYDVTYIAKWELVDERLASFIFRQSSSGFIITGVVDRNITEVSIPDIVVGIDESVFANCVNIKKITGNASIVSIAAKQCIRSNYEAIITDGTTIGYSAFSRCYGLTSITIPDSVTYIGDFAFYFCSGLTEIIIGNSVTDIGNEAFSGCTGLTNITIPNSVTSIGNHAFGGCTSLTSITIPDSVTSIGDSAFSSCHGLTSITIPDNVTNIGDDAFNGCIGLATVNWNAIACTSAGSYDGCIFKSCHNLSIVNFGSNVTAIPAYTFWKCSGLSNITIPDSVTDIGNKAFSGCTGLTNITIPDSVTSIGDSAFSGCTGLTSITIPDSVTSIGDSAFYGCTGLTSITIPDSVTSIGYGAFEDCSNLAEITIPDSVTSIGGSVVADTAWYNNLPDGLVYLGRVLYEYKGTMPDNTSIEIKDGTIKISNNAFYECSGLTSITIPDSVTYIGDFAFYFCSGLTEIIIGNSVTNIGNGAFSRCTGLTSITIPDSVTSIGYLAFDRCTGLTSITIPDSVTSIGSSVVADTAWYNNLPDGLVYLGRVLYGYKGAMPDNTSIEIKEGTVQIGGSAFSGCTGLTSITIPDSVTSIGDSAFSGCTGLTNITIPDSVTSIGDSAFSGCTGLTSITIPNSVTNIADRVFSGCSSLTSITIPDSVTSIGYYAFSGCTGLTSITIPDSVTSIGSLAFEWCSSLTSIIIPDGVIYIAPNIFRNCRALTSVTIPSSVRNISDLAFEYCRSLNTLNFSGSREQWNSILKTKNWNASSAIKQIVCIDGTITLQ